MDARTSDDSHRARTAGLLLVAGAVAWVPARWGVMTTWDTTWLGLGYVGWNRLVLVPLALLFLGAVGEVRDRSTGSVRVGWLLVAAGFAVAWAGVVLEFVVGGGLRGGPRVLAMAGWTAYVQGTLLAGLGAAVLAVSLVRDRTRPRRTLAAAALALAAAAMLAWPLAMMTGLHAAGVVDQLLVGLAWAAVGLATYRRGGRQPADVAAHLPRRSP